MNPQDYVTKEGTVLIHRVVSDMIENKNYLTFQDTEEIYSYDPTRGVYQGPVHTFVEQEALTRVGTSLKRNHLSEILKFVKVKTYFDRANLADTDIEHLCIKNGILNIKKRELSPHTPIIQFTNRLPLTYDQKSICPKIIQFLKDTVGEKHLNIVQEMFGYTLIKENKIQKSFLLVGSGSNGKSTFIDLFVAFFGKTNCSAISLQDLQENKYAAAELENKYINVYPDLGHKSLDNTDKFKTITCGEEITIEMKFQRPRKIKPFCKQIYSANELPFSSDSTDGFYRRWIILKFNQKFTDANKDTDILEKLTTKEELSGLLNWALDGHDRLVKNKKFSYDLTPEQIRTLYSKISDSIQAFTDEAIYPDFEQLVSKKEIYNLYIEYCKESELPAKVESVFNKELKKRFNLFESRPTMSGIRERAWTGIAINPDFKLTKSNLNNLSLDSPDTKFSVNVQPVQPVKPFLLKENKQEKDNSEIFDLSQKYPLLGLSHYSVYISSCISELLERQSSFSFEELYAYAKSATCSTAQIDEYMTKQISEGLFYEELPGRFAPSGK